MPERQEHFARHGGVHFSNRVPPEEINRFVRELPPEKRESLFEVLKELEQAGMNRHSQRRDLGRRRRESRRQPGVLSSP